jgi:Bacterial phospho-glucose isomerase C-terminal SIS domain
MNGSSSCNSLRDRFARATQSDIVRPMLDSSERFEFDSTQLARQLELLPGSYAGGTRTLPAPYGVIGFGEGALGAEFARDFIDAASVSGGTQFILAGGLDFGAVDAATLISEASGATVFQMGSPRISRVRRSEDEITMALLEDDDDDEAEVARVEPGPLATYHYAMALAHMTGNAEKARAAEIALERVRDACKADVPTDENLAKQLAWKLWTRTPLLIAAGGFSVQPWAWQLSLARLGKSISIPVPGNALEIASSGFEARHESGDSLVALFLGGEDESLRVAREILETRVDEVIVIPTAERDTFAANLELWYLSCWVGFYLSLMYSADPMDSATLRGLRDVE